MNEYLSNDPPVLSEDTHQFLTWWNAARENASPPSRDGLKIEKITRLLPRITVIEAVEPDRLMFRLSGTDIDTYAGIKVTGVNVLDITGSADRDLRSRRLWNYVSQPCGGVFWFRSPFSNGDELVGEGLSLPVLPAEGPRQIWSLFVSFRDTIRRDDDELDLKQVMPAFFRYIDFGSGVPDDGSGTGADVSALLANGSGLSGVERD